MARPRWPTHLSNSSSPRRRKRSLPNLAIARLTLMWPRRLPASSLRWQTCSQLPMPLVDGQRPNRSTLVTQASTIKRLLMLNKANDKYYSSIDDYSPPCPLASVGRTRVCFDLSGSAAAHPAGRYLSRRAEGWVVCTMAICFTARSLECSQAYALDLGSDGGYQCNHGNLDRLCAGALQLPRQVASQRDRGPAAGDPNSGNRRDAGRAVWTAKHHRQLV